MITTKEKELQGLKTIVKYFQVARSLREGYEIPKYIKVEKDKIKMTDSTFLVELPNNFGLKEQYIEIDSFLEKGDLDHQFEYGYPDFNNVIKVYGESFKFELDIKEFLRKIDIRYKKPDIGIDMVLRIIKNKLYVYLRFRGYRCKYRKLGIITLNNSVNINSRLMVDPVKFLNILKIFKIVGSKKLEVKFKAFTIREWKNNSLRREWDSRYPVELKTENCYSLIMQRG